MLNHVIIMGRPVHTPEVKTSGDTTFVRLRIACDRDVPGKDGNRVADFLDAVAFGKTAEFVGKYVAKGRLVALDGRIQTREYTDRDGNKRTSVEILADRVYFADSPKKDDAPRPVLNETPVVIKPETEAYAQRILEDMKSPLKPVEVADDDLPF